MFQNLNVYGEKIVSTDFPSILKTKRVQCLFWIRQF